MNLFRYVAIFFCLFFVGNIYANQCSNLKGNEDFTISFQVEGDDDYQDFYLKQGSHGHVIWYTNHKRSDPSYIFNEQNLIDDRLYEVTITNDASNDEVKYYRRDIDNGLGASLIETKYESLKNGSLSPVYDDDDITNVSCSDGFSCTSFGAYSSTQPSSS